MSDEQYRQTKASVSIESYSAQRVAKALKTAEQLQRDFQNTQTQNQTQTQNKNKSK